MIPEKVVRVEGLTQHNMAALLRLLDKANPEQLLKISNEAMLRLYIDQNGK